MNGLVSVAPCNIRDIAQSIKVSRVCFFAMFTISQTVTGILSPYLFNITVELWLVSSFRVVANLRHTDDFVFIASTEKDLQERARRGYMEPQQEWR